VRKTGVGFALVINTKGEETEYPLVLCNYIGKDMVWPDSEDHVLSQNLVASIVSRRAGGKALSVEALLYGQIIIEHEVAGYTNLQAHFHLNNLWV
jgi:hypothetical protein